LTRLASFCSGVLEVVNAVAVRLEDVIGELVDGLGPRPIDCDPTGSRAKAILARWNDNALIDWSGDDGGKWVFGVSNATVEDLIDDTAEYFRLAGGRP
jgi:hypothetical protein